MNTINRIPCSDEDSIILGLMEILRINDLIGKTNEYGGPDELLFHSGGPLTKKSTRSIIIGPSKFRFKARQPSKENLPPNNEPIDPLNGIIQLETNSSNLTWEVEKWEENKWAFIQKINWTSLSKSLSKLEQFLPDNNNAPGTICGAFAYDLCQWTQPLRLINPPKENSLLGVLFSMERWIIHDREKGFLEIGGDLNDPWVKKTFKLINSISDINNLVPNWPKSKPINNPNEISNFTDLEHEKNVIRVQNSIKAGELYQLNFGRKWRGPLNENPWTIQLRLAKQNPAPWSCYLYSHDLNFSICSSSPEILIQGDGVYFSTSPIKGTKQRGDTKEKDLNFINDLISCPKERAEHLMLVDLERNDMTKFCKLGSIYREKFQVESYAQVHHLVSDIKGTISEKYNAWDALESMFPGGSISGCPKTVTIAAIDQLEGEPRSFWTGSMGVINHKNNSLALNILIRTLEAHKINSQWEGVIQAGGGLVIGSNPKNEVEEAKLKAAALRKITGWLNTENKNNYPSKSLSNYIINTNKNDIHEKDIGKVSIWPEKINSKKTVAFVDNLDSFSWNIVNDLALNGANVCIIPGRENSPKFDEIIELLAPSHIIIGPGPGTPIISNLTMEIASNALNGNCPPLLGICLGHQAIGLAAGWDLCKTPTGAVHGEVHIIENINSTLIKSNNKMTRYHSLTLIKPNKNKNGLKVVAKLKNIEKSIMAIEHEKYPIFGVQFHPESEESENRGEIFKNFLNC
ncbi:MAG: chorismate-binding protein [Candidatus Thermoplasmatota archaeon]|nr:chorismate-binding protein [Candidatus Thermoplasmatota archaeon]